jgi:hypothetical protein
VSELRDRVGLHGDAGEHHEVSLRVGMQRSIVNMGETVFLKDSEWNVIDGRACRVLEFTPLMAEVTNSKVVALNRTPPSTSEASARTRK